MGNNINVEFSRTILAEVHREVKAAFPTINLRKDAWVYHFGGTDTWEFHGPNSFYTSFKADNAYDARVQGWNAYLRKFDAKALEG